jgi:hypothetical protein
MKKRGGEKGRGGIKKKGRVGEGVRRKIVKGGGGEEEEVRERERERTTTKSVFLPTQLR